MSKSIAGLVSAFALVASCTEASRPPSPADFPEMVTIPAGSFTMGSPTDEPAREADEDQHQVAIQSFAVSKNEITFAQWDACVAAGGCGHYRPGDQGWGRGNHPVIKVSWDDARHYMQWLSQVTGQRYRLLTEAEWEYAARAGTTTAYATGATINPSQARFGAQSTAAVGSYPANAFGLHDMHGNVWEWVEDCYAESYANAPSDGGAVGGNCDYHVLRGGAWLNDATGLRSADRFKVKHSDRDYYLGFRIARTLN